MQEANASPSVTHWPMLAGLFLPDRIESVAGQLTRLNDR